MNAEFSACIVCQVVRLYNVVEMVVMWFAVVLGAALWRVYRCLVCVLSC